MTEQAEQIKTISLTQGLFAIVDAEDYERVNQYKWHARCEHGYWYASRKKDGRTYKLHWEIIGRKDGLMVDHRNGNGLDCRKSNLRHCTRSENMMNSQKMRSEKTATSCKYKGVRRSKNGKFEARIMKDGKRISLGTFEKAEQAAKAYDDAAREQFGDFARTNFEKYKTGIGLEN
jgi:hypothetical protein